MKRVYNLSAGPSRLPEEVLRKAQSEMLNYGSSGMSVMEMSHRSKAFMEILTSAEHNLREIMQIPANYKILFLQGGASSQIAMVLADNKINIEDMINKSRGDYAYTIIDVTTPISDFSLLKIEEIKGILKVRVI